MKKQIKWTAALSTAAIMTALIPGVCVPAMAAETTGWIQADGTWMFYDSDGYALTDSWQKQDGNWYYLDEDGMLSFDRQIDEYYVGTDGKRVYNQWIKVVNDDNWDSRTRRNFTGTIMVKTASPLSPGSGPLMINNIILTARDAWSQALWRSTDPPTTLATIMTAS